MRQPNTVRVKRVWCNEVCFPAGKSVVPHDEKQPSPVVWSYTHLKNTRRKIVKKGSAKKHPMFSLVDPEHSSKYMTKHDKSGTNAVGTGYGKEISIWNTV